MINRTPSLAKGWLTTDQAAELAGLTPAGFRKEVQRSAELSAVRAYLGPLACYPEAAVRAWIAGRPGKGNRTKGRARACQALHDDGLGSPCYCKEAGPHVVHRCYHILVKGEPPHWTTR
jgi:hypothetical protein